MISKLLLVGFFGVVLVRVWYLGINLAGATLIGQLILIDQVDRWTARHAWRSDPHQHYLDENSVVRCGGGLCRV